MPIRLPVLLALSLLASCAPQTATGPAQAASNVSQKQEVYALSQTYADAAHAATLLITTGKASDATVATIKADDAVAYGALGKVRDAVKAGQVLTGTDMVSVTAAVTAYAELVGGIH